VTRDVLGMSVTHLRDAAAANELRVTEAVRASFARADEVGAGRDGLNAILWSDEEASQREAAALSKRVERSVGARPAHGSGTELLGVPACARPPRHDTVLGAGEEDPIGPIRCGSRGEQVVELLLSSQTRWSSRPSSRSRFTERS